MSDRKEPSSSARTDEKIEQQQREIEGLQHSIAAAKFELPLLRISQEILMVPLVGAMDSMRSQRVMQNILDNIRSAGTKVIVIDIAGVNVVDSSVASHLIKMGLATKLMGATTIISGISPDMATNIVNLGIQTGDTETTNTLEDALNRAYRHVGLALVATGNADN
ncbi:MAG TPA: STAS domain-containing protein [Marinobacterium sp.]|nr:STAS domain-containing protein [Marinobacterium sp.]